MKYNVRFISHLLLLFIISFLSTLLLNPRKAVSATDGILGTLSSATAQVSLNIAEQFRISNAKTYLDLNAYNNVDNLRGHTDLCIYSNGDGGYQVRITDNSSSNTSFALENTDQTASLIMKVTWSDTPGTAGAQTVPYGSPLAMSFANTTSSDCSTGGMNANIGVEVLGSNMKMAQSGNYRSTLAVIIEPN
ncbi:MAG: hypothetical protein OXT65_02340 [Alphaproteobacteria bacterium]|nr:hypothetical protein [Alphaproteobacteria bacterium]